MMTKDGFGPLVVGLLGDHQHALELDAIHVALDRGLHARWRAGAGRGSAAGIPEVAGQALWRAAESVLGADLRAAQAEHHLEWSCDLPLRAGLPWEVSWATALLRSLPTRSSDHEPLARDILEAAGLSAATALLPAALRGGVTHCVWHPARFCLPLPTLEGHLALVATDAAGARPASPPDQDALRALATRLADVRPGFDLGRATLEELHDGLMQLRQPAPQGFWEEIHQRDLTQAGRTVLEGPSPDLERLGELVEEAQRRRDEWQHPGEHLLQLRAALREASARCVRWAGPAPGGYLLAWTVGDPAALSRAAGQRGHEVEVARVLPAT